MTITFPSVEHDIHSPKAFDQVDYITIYAYHSVELPSNLIMQLFFKSVSLFHKCVYLAWRISIVALQLNVITDEFSPQEVCVAPISHFEYIMNILNNSHGSGAFQLSFNWISHACKVYNVFNNTFFALSLGLYPRSVAPAYFLFILKSFWLKI